VSSPYDAIAALVDPSRALLLVLLGGRVAGLVAAAPLFGSLGVPWRVRAFFALLLTLLIAPLQLERALPEPSSMLDFAAYAAVELAIGLLLGLGVSIYLQALQLAGHVVSQAAGLSMAEVFAPGVDTHVPVLSQLLHWLALVTFLMLSGHRLVMEGFLQSFAALPLGQGTMPPDIPHLLTTMLSQSFQLGVRIAAPALVAVLLATMVLGLISRALPQLNVMAMGLSLNVLVGLTVLALSLGTAAWAFEDQLGTVMGELWSGLTASAAH
jgi:flagellar biosynthetic protein FliR